MINTYMYWLRRTFLESKYFYTVLFFSYSSTAPLRAQGKDSDCHDCSEPFAYVLSDLVSDKQVENKKKR